MPGIEDHDAFVRENQEGRHIVVVGLEIRTDEDLVVDSGLEIVLGGLDVAVHVDVGNVGTVDAAGGVLVMQGPGIGEPTPGSFLGNEVALVLLGHEGTTQQDEYDRLK
jgi:hypothetical protein